MLTLIITRTQKTDIFQYLVNSYGDIRYGSFHFKQGLVQRNVPTGIGQVIIGNISQVLGVDLTYYTKSHFGIIFTHYNSIDRIQAIVERRNNAGIVNPNFARKVYFKIYLPVVDNSLRFLRGFYVLEMDTPARFIELPPLHIVDLDLGLSDTTNLNRVINQMQKDGLKTITTYYNGGRTCLLDDEFKIRIRTFVADANNYK